MVTIQRTAAALHLKVRRWLRMPAIAYAPVLIAGASLAVAAYYVEKSYGYSSRINRRVESVKALDIRAANVQERIRFELTSAAELQRTVSAQPDLSEADFDAAARSIMAANPDILQVSATALGGQSRHVSRGAFLPGKPIVARTTRQNTMTGSLPGYAAPDFSEVFLATSGVYGFQITLPVFTRQKDLMAEWGSVTVILDAKAFMRKVGLAYSSGTYHYAIRSDGGGEGAFKPFFRADQVHTIFASDPVLATVDALSSRWQIAALPVYGWDKPPEEIGLVRLGFLFVGALILVPFIRGARLRRQNDRHRLALARREKALKKLTQRLDLALESYQCGVWEAAANVEQTYWDERMQELHGVRGRADPATRRHWLNLIHPDDKAEAREALQQAMATFTRFSLTARVVRPDGELRHIRYVGQFHEGPSREQRLYGIAIDVTEDVELAQALRQAKTEAEAKNAALETALEQLSGRERELNETSQRLKLAMEAYGGGIWENNLDLQTHYWDARMHELYNVPMTNGQTAHNIWLSKIHPDDRERALAAREVAIERRDRYACTYRIMPTPDTIRHLRVMGMISAEPGEHRKFIGLAIDATADILKEEALLAAKNDAEAKRAELEAMHASMEHGATHDPLTGLSNRRALDDVLERLAHEDPDTRGRATLLHIDLDRFKQINDTLGHAAGDAMLMHAAEVLRQNTRKVDLVARIGGDEFVVLIRNDASNRDIATMAQRIIERMNVPVQFEGHECRFGVSIGIAREQARRNSVKKLLVNADIALYRAKAHGRNRYEFFTASLQAEIKRNKKLADEILRGIENDEFETWYQPQFSAKTQDLIGVEALVRWQHPERGVLTPDTFLKTAEEINALATLDHRVLEMALADRMRWAAAGLVVPKISVNVSARRLRDDQLVKSLKDLAITRGQIAFELVESIYLDDDDDVINRNIRRLKALGIDIEIDDFGTGHTSIVSLLKLEPKRLKIDRQLVQPMLTSGREFSLVRSIIEIGASLDIETVAEGVETMTHALRLHEMGCSALQGFAFARPMPGSELPGFVAASPWRDTGRHPLAATGYPPSALFFSVRALYERRKSHRDRTGRACPTTLSVTSSASRPGAKAMGRRSAASSTAARPVSASRFPKFKASWTSASRGNRASSRSGARRISSRCSPVCCPRRTARRW